MVRPGNGVVSGKRKQIKTGGQPQMNCTPFVRQYDILNNKWGALLCRKEYQTNAIHQNSRSRLFRQSYRTSLAIRRPPEFMKFKDMTASKVGNGFIWKREQKVLRWSAEGAAVQADQKNCPAK